MPDKRSLPLRFALSFVAVALIAPVASAAQHVRIGVQAGMNSWEEDLSTPIPGVEDQTLSGDEAGLGVVAQWVIEAEADTGFFIGFEGALAQENMSDTTTVTVGAFSADVTGAVVRTVDLLWFGGYDFGRVSAYFGAGPSIASGEGQIQLGAFALDAEKTHIGWKFGPGIEVDLGSSMSVIARATFGSYRNRAYTAEGFPVAVDVEPRVAEIRVAWVYRVNLADIMGLFGR